MAILSRWREEVDGSSLSVVRVGLGLALAWEVVRFFQNGWVAGLYGTDQFRFHYIWLEWVRPWPALGMHLHFGALGVLAVALALGWRTRTSSALLALGWAYVFLLDQANYLNHLYLVVLVLILLAWIPLRGGRAPGWGLDLMRLQVGVVYVFGGLAKINEDWIAGEPMTQWMSLRGDMPVIGAWLTAPEVGLGLSWVGLAFDLLVVPALLWRRTRWLALAVAVVFHAGNALLFHIGIFPWLMLVLTTVFLPPGWPRRWLRSEPMETLHGTASWGMGLRMGLAVWVAVQLALPLRHWAYPGDVAWTEEGHRFAWRMKLRSKKGRVFFHILNRQTGEREKLDPCEMLPLRHCRKMSTRPDMILQYAHHIRDERAGAGQQVAVHADAIARLNQRRPQRLIDAQVDLAQQYRTLAPASWIVPPLPRRTFHAD